MMTQFELCLALAREIVEAHKLPDGIDFLAFDVGGSDSSGSTRFSRQGTSATQKQFTLPSDLASLIQHMYTGADLPTATTGAEQSLLQQLLTGSLTSLPGLSSLQSMWNIDPVNFGSRASLDTIAARNPYSTNYETAIGELYDRQFGKARALAQSGPTNVRGGTARQGFELAELGADQARNKFREIRGQQDREAGVVTDAVRTAQAIESMRRGSILGAQGQNVSGEMGRRTTALQAAGGVNDIRRANSGVVALAADMLGKPTQTTTDNISGRGNQVSSTNNWGVGLTCCFIFLEALNGDLPWYVRRGRDDFQTCNRRNGYVWMSHWLIPLMRRSGLIASLVNWIMIKPFLIVGRWWYIQRIGILGPALKPWCWAWFHLWSLIGWTLWQIQIGSMSLARLSMSKVVGSMFSRFRS